MGDGLGVRVGVVVEVGNEVGVEISEGVWLTDWLILGRFRDPEVQAEIRKIRNKKKKRDWDGTSTMHSPVEIGRRYYYNAFT